MGNQLSVLNRQVGRHAELKDIDLVCLELLNQLGPLSPSALAWQTGTHPATMTGVLNRLEQSGWVTRERDRDATDRRAVIIRALPDRVGEIFGLYKGMNRSMDRICSDYTEVQLELILDFIERTTAAGQDAATKLIE